MPTVKCPVCKSDAEELERGFFDGHAIKCPIHGEVEFSDTVRASLRNSAIAKRADAIEDTFAKRAEDIWADDPECSRTEALRKARLENPALFAALSRV